jgi:FkbM family methyltransferase
MVQNKLIAWFCLLSLVVAALGYASRTTATTRDSFSTGNSVAAHPRILINSTQRGEECLLPAGVVVITTKTIPPFQLGVYPGDDIVSNRIQSDGIWEKAVLAEVWTDLVQPTGGVSNPRVFVDIGANVGFFTIYAAMMGARVVAFEPLKQNVDLVKFSACLNGVGERIELYGIGLKTQAGECVTVAGGANRGDAHLECTGEPSSLRGVGAAAVSVDRLDHYVRGRHIDLLKIDIEGFEQEAMESGLGAWRDPATGGAPSKVVFECNRNMALQRGLDTLFWLDFAREFSCSFDHYLEMGIPSWVSVLPLVSRAVLTRCGGSNHVLSCRGTESDWLLPTLLCILVWLLWATGFSWLAHSVHVSRTARFHVA